MLLLTYFTPYSDIHRSLTSRPNINVCFIWHQDRTLILDHVRVCFNCFQMPETSIIQYAFAIADVAKLLWPKDHKMKPTSDFNHMVACYRQCFYPWNRPWPKDPKMKPISDFSHLDACYVQCFYPWMTDHDPKTPRWNQCLFSITLLLATCNAATHEW